MKGEWRSAPRGGGLHKAATAGFRDEFQLSPRARFHHECAHAGLTADSRHCALSSAHGAKLCTDAQHGGGGYDATIVVIGLQDRSDKGRLVSASPGAPRACRHLPLPLTRGPFGSSFA